MNISVKNIYKTFNDVPVIQKLSFELKEGMVLGLLGPNGAGKTTTLRMILDILRPDEGEILFDQGRINKNLRRLIGYLPEERGLYQNYKVIDVLIYLGRLKNLSKRKSYVEAVRLLDRFQLIDSLESPVSHLSKGNQQLLQFLTTIIHRPQILIVDEPFVGLDPINQEMVRAEIRAMKANGKLILLSTHQLTEAEALCDYFVLIDHGQTVLKGTLKEIQKNFKQNMIFVESTDDLTHLREIQHIQKISVKNSRAILSINEKAPIREILQEIINSVNVTKIEINKPNLNDIFLQAVKGKHQV
ncbi:MAG TPA: ATP-binding cassette domain-containing protein [Caldithrix sp.]|nr:ATP-binding cassette domain-containing protein [Caldithrix sp.]